MADEIDLEKVELEAESKHKVEERIKDLSGKVKTASDERDAERKQKEDAEAKRIAAEKERDFYKGFSKISSKYPQASEFQDAILEKHNPGYDLEDAAVAVLAKEGKFIPQELEKENPAGGSAKANPTLQKPQEEWTQEERRKFLEENLINV